MRPVRERFISGSRNGGTNAFETNMAVDFTPDTIAKLSEARTHALEVELAPNTKVQVSLPPPATSEPR